MAKLDFPVEPRYKLRSGLVLDATSLLFVLRGFEIIMRIHGYRAAQGMYAPIADESMHLSLNVDTRLRTNKPA